MNLEPFKGREIDPDTPVRVYRNLGPGLRYSVQQGGLVAAHADEITLFDCRFIVSEAGNARVREEGRKNVHAYVEGYVGGTPPDAPGVKVGYNPYHSDHFTLDGFAFAPIYEADLVTLDATGARAYGHFASATPMM